MKPAPVDYVAPESLDAALALLAEHGFDAKLLAGGQSLVPLLNFRLAQPGILIDLNRLSELDYVRESPGGGLLIGAMTRQRTLERDLLVKARAPLLAEAVPLVAHPQIRNRGTVGGSLAHADPAAELPVVAVTLDARFRLQSTSGERWVGAREFYLSLMTTALEPEEMLVEVELPALPERSGCAFLEQARRHGDYATSGLAAVVSLEADGRCKEARLVYLCAGDIPAVATEAAAGLVGSSLDDGAIRAAAELATSREIEPTTDIHASSDYKRHLARVLTERALRLARTRAAGGAS
jgi:carbon-monoxide dehydrogenase medium subunit